MPTPIFRLPTLPPAPPLPPARAARAAARLQQLGWEPAQLLQIALYAQQPPQQKLAQMLRIRHQMMTLLRARLAAENPTLDTGALNQLVCSRIDEYYRLYG